MIGRTRGGIKYLFWGMVIGYFFAPLSGKESRARILSTAKEAVNSVAGAIWKLADSRQS